MVQWNLPCCSEFYRGHQHKDSDISRRTIIQEFNRLELAATALLGVTELGIKYVLDCTLFRVSSQVRGAFRPASVEQHRSLGHLHILDSDAQKYNYASKGKPRLRFFDYGRKAADGFLRSSVIHAFSWDWNVQRIVSQKKAYLWLSDSYKSSMASFFSEDLRQGGRNAVRDRGVAVWLVCKMYTMLNKITNDHKVWASRIFESFLKVIVANERLLWQSSRSTSNSYCTSLSRRRGLLDEEEHIWTRVSQVSFGWNHVIGHVVSLIDLNRRRPDKTF